MEGEAGANDPMAVFLTLAAIELLMSPDPSYTLMAGSFLQQMIGGVAIGLVLGKIGSYAVKKINMDAGGLDPTFAISFAFIIYSSAQFALASGFLTVYAAALVIGNSELTLPSLHQDLPRRICLDGTDRHVYCAWSTGYPGRHLFLGSYMDRGAAFFLIMFITRPASRFSLNDQLFLSWAGLRGAVPIILATLTIAFFIFCIILFLFADINEAAAVLTSNDIGWFLLLGIVGTGISFILYVIGIRLTTPSKTSMVAMV